MRSKANSTANNDNSFQRIRAVGRLLDNAIPIPGTSYRIGIDPILGLLPGGGDLVGLFLSAYIVLEAARFRLPKETLLRMVTNLVLDSVVGAVPVLGDFFDFSWKANARNIALLEAHLANPNPQRAADRQFVIAMVVIIVLIGVGAIALVAVLINLLGKIIGG